MLPGAKATDYYATYAHNPDLSNEWNVLVRHGGMGWGGMITLQAILMLIMILLFACCVFGRRYYPPEPGLSFYDFCSLHLYRQRVPIWYIAWKMPKGIRINVQIVGYIFIRIGILIALFGAGSWYWNNLGYEPYGRIYNLLHPYGSILFLIGLGYGFFFRFLHQEYRAYRERNCTTASREGQLTP